MNNSDLAGLRSQLLEDLTIFAYIIKLKEPNELENAKFYKVYKAIEETLKHKIKIDTKSQFTGFARYFLKNTLGSDEYKRLFDDT